MTEQQYNKLREGDKVYVTEREYPFKVHEYYVKRRVIQNDILVIVYVTHQNFCTYPIVR